MRHVVVNHHVQVKGSESNYHHFPYKKAPLNFREALAIFIKLFFFKELLNEYRQEIVQPFEQGVL